MRAQHPSLAELMQDLEGLRHEVRELRLLVEGKKYRDRLIGDLAKAIGLGPTWAGAQAVALVIQGVQDAPPAVAAIADALRADRRCPRSARQVHRILEEIQARDTADKSTALCQFFAAGKTASVHSED